MREKAKPHSANSQDNKEIFVASGAYDFWLNEEDDIYDELYGEDQPLSHPFNTCSRQYIGFSNTAPCETRRKDSKSRELSKQLTTTPPNEAAVQEKGERSARH